MGWRRRHHPPNQLVRALDDQRSAAPREHVGHIPKQPNDFDTRRITPTADVNMPGLVWNGPRPWLRKCDQGRAPRLTGAPLPRTEKFVGQCRDSRGIEGVERPLFAELLMPAHVTHRPRGPVVAID